LKLLCCVELLSKSPHTHAAIDDKTTVSTFSQPQGVTWLRVHSQLHCGEAHKQLMDKKTSPENDLRACFAVFFLKPSDADADTRLSS